MLPRAHLEVFSTVDRRVFQSKRLGLDPGKIHGLPGHGGNGPTTTSTCFLRSCATPAACRPSSSAPKQQAYNDLVHWRANHPEFTCYNRGLLRHRPFAHAGERRHCHPRGTTTCAKALTFRCPIVFNAFGGIMPQRS